MFHNKGTDLLMAATAYIVLKQKKDPERDQRRQRKRRRKYAVKPEPCATRKRVRVRPGKYVAKLDRHPKVCYSNFHMDEKCFEQLFKMTEPYMAAKRNTRPDAIPLESKLAMVLEYLAVGDIQTHMGTAYGVSGTHFGVTLELVCNAIIKALANEFPLWTAERIQEWAQEFKTVLNFPNTMGAIDGKHIAIAKPSNSGNEFYNNKGYCSILLLAVSDASCRFSYVDVGAQGSESDMTAFSNSSLGQAMLSGSMKLPEDSLVNGVKIPYFLVGDNAFPLHKRIMRPYTAHTLTDEERNLNYRLNHVSGFVKNAFAIFSEKWTSTQGTLRCQPERAQKIVLTCCSLHNFLMRVHTTEYATLKEAGLDVDADVDDAAPESCSGRTQEYPKLVRDVLKNFVNSSAGAVTSQF